jgi:dienelactone hydrolase
VNHFRLLAIGTAALAAVALAACTDLGGELPSAVTSPMPGPQGGEGMSARRQLWHVPSQKPGLLMHALLFRPPGPGPFPLAVINHGSEQDAAGRLSMPLPSFEPVTDWFLARRYAVLLPQRPGHGRTGGDYHEDQGSCNHADFVSAGNAAADSIATAIDYMIGQPFIEPDGVVVVGNSAGGWGALALAGRSPPAVAAVVNFSGGRGGHHMNRPLNNCSPDRLVAAAAVLGRTARLPTLWLYAANDSYFPPDLSRRMADAFRAAGGDAEYHLVPPIHGEGHRLIQASGPDAPWVAYVETFLHKRRIGGN